MQDGVPERDDRIDYAPQFDEVEADDNADLTLRLHSTTDARVWAEEWIRVATEMIDHMEGDPLELILDEGWMVGWFANAIEVGRDAGVKEGFTKVWASASDPDEDD